MRAARKSRGFTLVELLVVISIIGMLMALLLPAIQNARESGRRNTCANNMRNVGLAMTQFENSRRYYPGYAAPILNAAGTPIARAASYIVQILPYLGNNPLYRSWTDPNAPQQFQTPFIEITTCPSDPSEVQGGRPPLAFCVNAGQADLANPTTQLQAAGGICFDQTAAAGAAVRIGNDYITSHDGTSTTILVSENIQTFSWAPEGASVAGDVQELLQRTTFLWWGASAGPPNPPLALNIINADKQPAAPFDESTNAAVTHCRPSSYHVNGVNVYFCDGHTRFISDDIAYNVYKQLMTPNGAIADSANTDPLDESTF